ncbi:hypothetical protein CEXT_15331 [Caerostris extrusa]|uniref:Uncharacterized protein n=1 Tax=Caerostris extrusa TaxID=172846 RepID=A0AAV4NCK9_CAEEX|nr:hypothetical protein CEXT_15331 [Caerostris extrusa]
MEVKCVRITAVRNLQEAIQKQKNPQKEFWLPRIKSGKTLSEERNKRIPRKNPSASEELIAVQHCQQSVSSDREDNLREIVNHSSAAASRGKQIARVL